LEAAWQKHLPYINIETAIQEMSNADHSHQDLSIDPESESMSSTQGLRHLNQFSAMEEPLSPIETPRYYESEEADTFEWDESTDCTPMHDGIGSLSVTRRGIGYMGPQSGNALLKNLQSIHMHLFPLQESEMILPSQPEPTIAEGFLQSSSFSECCIDWYFELYNCAYPILHEGYFRAQCIGIVVLSDSL
jgi:hypothetical protein